MDYITKEDKKVQILYSSCFGNRCFADYYQDQQAAVLVEEVEKFAESMLDDFASSMTELSDEELSPGEKKDLRIYKKAKEGKTSYLYAWNRVYDANGETHGTVLAMCFKSDDPLLHALGRRILLDLDEVQGNNGHLDFDT